MEKTPTYYQLHKAERSAYAKQYYKNKKQSKILEGISKKPKKSYKTWKSNQPQIEEHKQYLAKNGIKEVVVRFSI
jgi:hypothetical protein